MIYIIGGAPRVGKSIVAKRIAERTHAALISTDDICDKAMGELSEEERKITFPMPEFSGTASENTLTPDQRVKLSLISAKSLESEIDHLISNALTRNESLVIEGVHLLPNDVRELLSKYGTEKFKTLFIGSTDVDNVVDGIMKNTGANNWLRESNADVIRQVAEFVSAFSQYVKAEADKNDLSYQERAADFEADMKRFCDQMTQD
jgi:2-phosphoglycerate kinase